jgi:hypothetical protein
VSAATTPDTVSWQDLVMLAFEIPVQWHSGASFLMNQTAVLLLRMSGGTGKPLLQSMQGVHDAPRWSIAGFPVYIASQMPDCRPGSTPVAFGNWKPGVHDRRSKSGDDVSGSIQQWILDAISIRGPLRRFHDMPKCCKTLAGQTKRPLNGRFRR